GFLLGLGLVHGRATAECGGGGCRARGKTPEQSKSRPVANTASSALLIPGGHEFPRKGDDVIEQLSIFSAKRVGFFFVQAFRECSVGIEEVPNVGPTTLNKVQSELLAERFAGIQLDLSGQVLELGVQET